MGPIPALGPTGAGVSTLVMALASVAALVLIARRAAPAAVTGRAPAVSWRDLAPVLVVGPPIGVAIVAELGIFLGATLYAARLGAADVAAHTLALRLAGVAYSVPAALLQAAMVRMARAAAVGDPDQRRAVTLGRSLVSGTALWLALAAVTAPLVDDVLGGSPDGLAAVGIATSSSCFSAGWSSS